MTAQFSNANPIRTGKIIPVSALNQAVSELLEQSFPLTWISGEISNFTRATSGHWYFSLKDHAAQVRAVMFRGRAQHVDFLPKEGDKVEVRATVGLYAPRGDFQITVENLRRAGVGNLFEAFLQLKAKLAAEGLFDAERKRTLPTFPKRIGIITSPQAAALQDVLSCLQRRAPHVEIRLYPCPVQGEGAANLIAQAIASACAQGQCELLLLCRGGGSIEDLWAFNDETLARTIAHSSIPIICGVGHESDFTIADFVADLRAPTPTAAAEMAATPRTVWLEQLQQMQQALSRQMQRKLQNDSQQLDWLSHRLQSPRTAFETKQLRLAQLARSLLFHGKNQTQQKQARLAQQQLRWRNARPEINSATTQLQTQKQQLSRALKDLVLRQKTQLTHFQAQLEMLNPQRTLERGYTIIRQASGAILRSAGQLQDGEQIQIQTANDRREINVKLPN